jgi:hypothetical protein
MAVMPIGRCITVIGEKPLFQPYSSPGPPARRPTRSPLWASRGHLQQPLFPTGGRRRIAVMPAGGPKVYSAVVMKRKRASLWLHRHFEARAATRGRRRARLPARTERLFRGQSIVNRQTNRPPPSRVRASVGPGDSLVFASRRSRTSWVAPREYSVALLPALRSSGSVCSLRSQVASAVPHPGNRSSPRRSLPPRRAERSKATHVRDQAGETNQGLPALPVRTDTPVGLQGAGGFARPAPAPAALVPDSARRTNCQDRQPGLPRAPECLRYTLAPAAQVAVPVSPCRSPSEHAGPL